MKFNNRFYYSRLSEDERNYMDWLIEGINRMAKEVRFEYTLAAESFGKIVFALEKDFPEFYYLDFSGIKLLYSETFSTVQLNYLYAREEVIEQQKKLKEITNMIITEKVLEMPLIQREKFIYDTLLMSTSYSDEENHHNHTILEPLMKNKGVCQGYAHAFQYLCEKAGIMCIFVSGKSRNSGESDKNNHAWNIVKISDDIYFHVDVTWDSCRYHCGSKEYHRYFNLTAEKMREDHEWNEEIFVNLG